MDELTRADKRITRQERVRTIDYLAWLASEANKAADWLGDAQLETEADLVEQAARTLLASCWMLERPLRAQPPPARWQLPDQPSPPGQNGG